MFPCYVRVMHLGLSDIKILASWQHHFANLSVSLWPLTGIFLLWINTKKGTTSCAAELEGHDSLWQLPELLQQLAKHRWMWEGRWPLWLPGAPVPGLALGSAAHCPDTNPGAAELSQRSSVLEPLLWCPHVQIYRTFRSCFCFSDPCSSVVKLGQQTQDLS